MTNFETVGSPHSGHRAGVAAFEIVRPDCFVVMPISDPEGYDAGHFKKVFEDLITPACEKAGFHPVRADQARSSNLIHLEVLQRLLDSPMVLCDLSSRNPNVLFELGLRQAFDRPVALIQESGTPRIFDIAPLRYTEYRKEMVYREAREDQDKIAAAILSTKTEFDEGRGVNSIVKMLSLTRPAAFVDLERARMDPSLQIIRAEINDLRLLVQQVLGTDKVPDESSDRSRHDIARASHLVENLEADLPTMMRGGAVDPAFCARLEEVKTRVDGGLLARRSGELAFVDMYRKLRERVSLIQEKVAAASELPPRSKVA